MPNSTPVMKTSRWIKIWALALCVMGGASAAHAETLRVFAAASLQGPLDTIAQSWPTDVKISYGGSGTLARQISHGAPADVVVLANAAWMGWLLEHGHITGPAVNIISNQLVVIGASDAAALHAPGPDDLMQRLNGERFAMGQHMSVPAGIYAREWLVSIGAWDALRPRLVETDSVRAALLLVARRAAPLGVVYASDAAAAAPDVAVLWEIPGSHHARIVYPAAALTAAGRDFVAHLSAHASAFAAAGFTALK